MKFKIGDIVEVENTNVVGIFIGEFGGFYFVEFPEGMSDSGYKYHDCVEDFYNDFDKNREYEFRERYDLDGWGSVIHLASPIVINKLSRKLYPNAEESECGRYLYV